MESGWEAEQSDEKKGAVLCPEGINMLKTSVIRCLLDEGLTFLWGNSSFFNIIHYSMEEYCFQYHDLSGYYSEYPEDYALIDQTLSQARRGKDTHVSLTVRLPIKGGGFLWTKLSGTIIDDPIKKGLLFQAEFTDVSVLMAENEELTRLHYLKLQYFRWMADTYVGNVYISDLTTYELLYLNRNCCKTLATTEDKALGRKCYEIIQGRNTPCPFCTNHKISEDADYEWEFDNPVLEKRFMIKNRIIEWEGHRARIELSHDMHSAEFKLAKKDQERNAIIEAVPGGFARVDAQDMTTVLWYGGGFLDIIGYTKEEFERDLHCQCTYVQPEDMERAAKIMQDARDNGKKTVVEGRIITRDGTIKILTMTYSYVSAKDSWDGIASFYNAVIDVTKERTEQARQRKALEDACQAARIANNAKTNFLSSMSHDIRTPMNAIMGMAVIAQANVSNPDKVKDCLTKINSSSKHLLGLINEVLDMSKIESGKIDLTFEEVSLPEVVGNVIDICQSLVSQKNQKLLISAEHVRHEKVVTDIGRLQQVLMNLVSNAVKYTPDGGTITLRLRERPGTIQGWGQYEFSVADNGIGMSKEFVEHIFEPFIRAEDSRISKIQGTGLGMTITENIVRMMNGTIEVKSALGEGSQFIFTVSLELCEEDEIYSQELAGLSVLVVDDDPAVCESAVELLNELGMCAEGVLSGKEAVSRIAEAQEKEEDFFSFIVDWRMPEMDGLETVKIIRKKLGIHVPIIMISAYDYSDVESEFRLAGADAFLPKPLFKSRLAYTFLRFRQNSSLEPVELLQNIPSALEGKRLLLVEDNKLNREIAAELFQMEGFLVDLAENGQIAVEKFQASHLWDYSCILMDIQMPVMDGYEAAETIRAMKREDAQSIPILALTANAFASDLGKALKAGMNDHISKPIDVRHLMEVLERWLI